MLPSRFLFLLSYKYCTITRRSITYKFVWRVSLMRPSEYFASLGCNRGLPRCCLLYLECIYWRVGNSCNRPSETGPARLSIHTSENDSSSMFIFTTSTVGRGLARTECFCGPCASGGKKVFIQKDGEDREYRARRTMVQILKIVNHLRPQWFSF